MELLDALFLTTKEPMEEKEIVSYLDEMGMKEGGLDQLSFDKRVKAKVFGGVVVYYPSAIPNGVPKSDNFDEKLQGHLTQQLHVIESNPTVGELDARVKEMRDKKDKMVIKYWAQNKERMNTREDDVKIFEEPHSPAVASVMNMKVAQLVHNKINLLHDLNDAKDETHRLFGLLAEINQCTVRDIIKRVQHNKEE